MRVYRRCGEQYSDVNVKEHDRYGGGSVMVWAAVTVHTHCFSSLPEI